MILARMCGTRSIRELATKILSLASSPPSLRGCARAHVYAPLRLPCTRVGTHTLARGTALDRIYRLYLRRYALEENLSFFPSFFALSLSLSALLFFHVSFLLSFLSVFTYSSFPPPPARCPERDSRKVFNPSRVVTRRREPF